MPSKTWGVKFSDEQEAAIRLEFDKTWTHSQIIKTVFADYFDARPHLPAFPADEHASGIQDTYKRGRGKR